MLACGDPSKPAASASASASSKGCDPLGSLSLSEADVRARAKVPDRELGANRLEERACGPYHVMHVFNGYTGTFYYLKDGKVIGFQPTSHAFNAPNCVGEIPVCE